MTEQVSGSATTQENSVPTEQSQQNDKVAYETYKRVLSEAKKLKEQVKQFEEQQSKSQEAALKEQQQWKALYEQREKEAKSLKEELAREKEAANNGIKLSVFERVLGGKIKHEDYYTHVPWNQMVINPENGKVDEESVKLAVSEFTKKHSHLVEYSTGKMPNAAAARVNFQGKSPDQMTKEELEQHIINLGKAGRLK